MPTWIAWHLHQLPMAFHQLSCLATFVLELLCPVLASLPFPPCRNIGAVGLIFFQFPLILTGNYAILNVLTIVLCMPLFEFPTKTTTTTANSTVRIPNGQRLPNWMRLFLLVHGLLGSLLLLRTVESLDYLSNTKWILNTEMYSASIISSFFHIPRSVFMLTSAWRVSNGYGGVFHDSFEHEGKIVLKLEGSVDGKNWIPIKWKWHVHAVDKRPALFHPYFPRLDHLIFYHANNIGFNQLNPFAPFSNSGMADLWFVNFIQKLLQHQKNVWSLLQLPGNDTSYKHINYIRANRELYRFTSTTDTSKNWWKITQKQLYMPPVCIHDADHCGRKNCLAMCILHTNSVKYCQHFAAENEDCRLPQLHVDKDPSQILFVNEEFLYHWLHTLPLSYLESLHLLYQMRSEPKKRGKVHVHKEHFSDGRLLRWAFGVYAVCLEGGATVNDALCQKLLNY